jgi:F0F1-type ATP synthase membrane subunit b/b'
VTAAGFSDTINLGSIILAAIAALGVIIGVFYGVRYKVSYEAASSAAEELRKSLADEKERYREEKEIAAAALVNVEEKHTQAILVLQEALDAARATISRLEQLPDVAQLMKWADDHETRAQERHAQTALVLSAIADKLAA